MSVISRSAASCLSRILALVLVLCTCLSLCAFAVEADPPAEEETLTEESIAQIDEMDLSDDTSELDTAEESVSEEADFEEAALPGEDEVEDAASAPAELAEAEDESAPESRGAGPVWSLNNGTLTITGTGAITEHPWTEDELSGTVLRAEIGDGVTSVPANCFSGCANLTAVTLPDSVTSIGQNAFSGCSSLSAVRLPAGLSALPARVFARCTALATVELPAALTSIGDYAFSGCTGLTALTLPNALTSVGTAAFSGCSKLDQFACGDGLTSFGPNALTGTAWLERQGEFAVLNGVLLRYQGSSSELSVPAEVTQIGHQAFAGCQFLQRVTVHSGVTAISDSAFWNCPELMLLGDEGSAAEAFAAGHGLPFNDVQPQRTAGTALAEGSQTVAVRQSAITYCSFTAGEAGYYIFTSDSNKDTAAILYDVSWNVLARDDNSGSGRNFKLQRRLAAGETLYLAVYYTDADASGNPTLSVSSFDPSGGRTISEPALTLGDNVVTIPARERVYYSFTAPADGPCLFSAGDGKAASAALLDQDWNSVSTDSRKLDGQFSLSCELVGGNVYLLELAYVGPNDSGDLTVHVTQPGNSGSCGAAAEWNFAEGRLTISGTGSVTSAPWSAFRQEITQVEVGQGITGLCDFAFAWHTSLSSATLPDSLTDLGQGAFLGCSSLTGLDIPAAVTALPASLCYNCTALRQVLIPATVKTIADDAFLFWDVTREGKIAITGLTISGYEPSAAMRYADKWTINFRQLGTCYLDLTDAEVTVADQTWTGEALEPVPTVKVNGQTLTGDDFEVTGYLDNMESGTATVNITGRGDYQGTASGTFQIQPAAQSVRISAPKTIYAGKTGKITATGVGELSYASSDPTVASVDDSGTITAKQAGSVTLTVTAAGDRNRNSGSGKVTVQVRCKTPVLQVVTSAPGGVAVRWAKCTGAAKYRVYRQNENCNWVGIGNTTGNVFLDTNVKLGYEYTYTVRCLDKNGNLVSGYDAVGMETEYVRVPGIQSVTLSGKRVLVKWKSFQGAAKYRLFCKTGNGGWKKVADTTSTSLYVTTSDGKTPLKNGTTYTFTLRCLNSKGQYSSSFYKTGWSITYYQPPVIQTIANGSNSITLTWKAVPGNPRCAVFCKNGTSWKRLGTVKGTQFTATTSDGKTPFRSGKSYTFTLRYVDANGKYCSSYLTAGKTIRYYDTPVLTSVSNTSSGVRIQWRASAGAPRYRVFRKSAGSGWKGLADVTATSYVDQTAVQGTEYAYTVRCLNSTGTAYVSSFDKNGLRIVRE